MFKIAFRYFRPLFDVDAIVLCEHRIKHKVIDDEIVPMNKDKCKMDSKTKHKIETKTKDKQNVLRHSLNNTNKSLITKKIVILH